MCGVFGIHVADARRRPARVLRPARAAAPRPGVGGDRRLRPRPADRAARPRPRRRRSSTSARCAGLRGDLAIGHIALLDHRRRTRGRTRSRSSTTAATRTRRARAQRQPRQRRRAADGARGWLGAASSDSETIAALVAIDGAARSRTRSRPRWRGSTARTPASRSPTASSSRSATRTASGRSASAGSGGRLGRRLRDVRARPDRRDATSARSGRASSWSSGADGELRSLQARRARRRRGALCIFEFFYLARPDSRLAGVEVHGARVRMGERLAAEAPAEADLVLPIPDSGTPAAIGFARASGIPFSRGADQEPLRRADVHPARPGPARARACG